MSFRIQHGSVVRLTISNKVSTKPSPVQSKEGSKKKRNEHAEQSAMPKGRMGKNREEACIRTCSVTSKETFILALLALLCSSSRPRVCYVCTHRAVHAVIFQTRNGPAVCLSSSLAFITISSNTCNNSNNSHGIPREHYTTQ